METFATGLDRGLERNLIYADLRASPIVQAAFQRALSESRRSLPVVPILLRGVLGAGKTSTFRQLRGEGWDDQGEPETAGIWEGA